MRQAMSDLPELTDVNTDAQDRGIQTSLVIDRDSASRLGVTPAMIDSVLNDAFGQRQVSTIYNPLNQYHVVMEVAPQFWQSPETLDELYVSTAGGSVGGWGGFVPVPWPLRLPLPRRSFAANAARKVCCSANS